MATKSLKKLAPSNQQKPGGDAGPAAAGKTNARLHSAPMTKLTKGTSESRGKGY